VTAHRCTDPTNLGALWLDLKGVLPNMYVWQMESASTFALKVVELLQEVTRIKGASFQHFFAGHSLGDWLAPVTKCTTEYLEREGSIFLQNNDEKLCFHPHTVVFDSPDCKDMFLQITDKIDVRLDGRSIDIEHLDITSYLSAPNRINSSNSHLWKVYRIIPDLSDIAWKQKHNVTYNVAKQNMDKTVEVFDPETVQLYKGDRGQLRVQVVADWPICPCLRRGKEYQRFCKWAKSLNNYHPDIKDISSRPLCRIRYQTKLYVEGVNILNVFSQEKQEFFRYRCQ